MFAIVNKKEFVNGAVYALKTEDDYPLEVTDTFLPFYTKFNINGTNNLVNNEITDRSERWMIGVSCMSGCPIECKFCATGKLKKCRNLTSEEIVAQVDFILSKNHGYNPNDAKEFKINYTRMGEPFLNIEAVKEAITIISAKYPNTHHYISTIGIKDADYSWIKGNITLQLSLHSLIEARRDNLIPVDLKVSIEDLGKIRTKSNLKTTINLTLVDEEDFNIESLKKYFDPEFFFIKLSPINVNEISENNKLGKGIIQGVNLL